MEQKYPKGAHYKTARVKCWHWPEDHSLNTNCSVWFVELHPLLLLVFFFFLIWEIIWVKILFVYTFIYGSSKKDLTCSFQPRLGLYNIAHAVFSHETKAQENWRAHPTNAQTQSYNVVLILWLLLWRFLGFFVFSKLNGEFWMGLGNKQQVRMSCKYKRSSFNRVRLLLLPRYHESNVNVCVCQGKSPFSLFTLLRLIIFIQKIHKGFPLAAPGARPSYGEKYSQKTGKHFGRFASSFIISVLGHFLCWYIVFLLW